ncbi:unnamed protein product [marine sediment metagenome]|uniref:Integrase SAM-like N-terminal domain-containing protein n=1 Tax=marine sediment metagenome TaxID=412755 RepID=X1E8Z5_9ZZZZ
MNEYINYFLNHLQTEKDAAKSTIHKYKANLKRLFDAYQQILQCISIKRLKFKIMAREGGLEPQIIY